MGPVKDSICKYCIHPGKCGVLGFTFFFLVIIATKFLGTVFGSTKIFTVDTEDLLLSLVGFLMFFAIKILNNFNERKIEGI
jgi:hypothetical protein